MANIFTNDFSTTPITLGSGEALVVATGATVATSSTTVSGVASGSNELLILGSLFSDNLSAIGLSDGNGLELIVGEAGGVYSTGGLAAVLRGTFQVTVINHGTISSTSSAALFAGGTFSDADSVVSVTNTGTLSGRTDALITSSGTQETWIVNSGTITTTNGYAVKMTATTGEMTLHNGGQISSGSPEGKGVVFSGAATINNSGVIQSHFTTIQGIGRLDLTNDGQILSNADETAISVAGGGSLMNSGQITGIVTFNGVTTFTNSGEILGRVNMTGGGTLSNTGEVRGSVAGSVGSDTIRNFGLVESDLFLVGGDDIVRNAGFVGGFVFLSDGNDTYRGFGGLVAETVNGGAGADTLNGGRFDDSFDGGDDADILRGRGGDDSLRGGAGKDTLIGGAGEDLFVFSASTDSGKGANADVIADFRRRVDEIDLSDFATDLTFIGTRGFSKTAGEVRIKAVAGATIVQIDEDGNGRADMEIRVLDVTTLSASDFIL